MKILIGLGDAILYIAILAASLWVVIWMIDGTRSAFRSVFTRKAK